MQKLNSQEIIENLRKKISENIGNEEFYLWFTSTDFQIKNKVLIINTPNSYFQEKIENNYKQIIIKALTTMQLSFEIKINIDENLNKNVDDPQDSENNSTPTTKNPIKRKFPISPKFQNTEKLESFLTVANDVIKINKEITKNTELFAIGGYGTNKIVKPEILDSRWWSYSSDKRGKAKVDLKLTFQEGSKKEYYELYRGTISPNKLEKGYGQLNTTHCKIFYALLYMWQEQCLYADPESGYYAVVKIKIKDILKKFDMGDGGINYKNIENKIIDIARSPYYLTRKDSKIGYSFFLFSVYSKRNEDDTNDTEMIVTFSPHISSMLYNYKAFLITPDILKLKNETAIKLFQLFDQQLYTGRNVCELLAKVKMELQAEHIRNDSFERSINRAIKELNGMEINSVKQYGFFNMRITKIKNKKYLAIDYSQQKLKAP
jgi:hypothetical protein